MPFGGCCSNLDVAFSGSLTHDADYTFVLCEPPCEYAVVWACESGTASVYAIFLIEGSCSPPATLLGTGSEEV